MVRLFLAFCCLFSGLAIGASRDPNAVPHDVEQRASQIVKKCVSKAQEIRQERICESKKKALELCLQDELKTKDMDKSQARCEHLFIL
jgi:hypothetical protein